MKASEQESEIRKALGRSFLTAFYGSSWQENLWCKTIYPFKFIRGKYLNYHSHLTICFQRKIIFYQDFILEKRLRKSEAESFPSLRLLRSIFTEKSLKLYLFYFFLISWRRKPSVWCCYLFHSYLTNFNIHYENKFMRRSLKLWFRCHKNRAS